MLSRIVENKIKFIGYLIFIIGLLGLVFPLISVHFYNNYSDNKKNNEDNRINNNFVGPDNNVWLATAEIKEENYDSVSGNRVLINNLNIDMPLISGNNSNAISKGGWVFPLSPLPGEIGNFVIFGHRFKYIPPLKNTFYNLDKIAADDRIKILWDGKEYEYSVDEIKIVEPEDLSVITPTKDRRVTLVTCTPLFTVKQRLVIVGKYLAP